MIHVISLRIVNGKTYRRKLERKFVRNIEEINQLEADAIAKFIAIRYPDGIPPQDEDSKTPFVSAGTTYITIPDHKFISYLVTELKYKRIPEDIKKLFTTVKLKH